MWTGTANLSSFYLESIAVFTYSAEESSETDRELNSEFELIWIHEYHDIRK